MKTKALPFAFTIALLIYYSSFLFAQSHMIRKNLSIPIATLPITNNSVLTTAISGNILYLGGQFTKVGLNSGAFAEVDRLTGNYIPGLPLVGQTNGSQSYNQVNAAIPDGYGGWFIAGDFTQVGNVQAKGLAHIKSDGSVDVGFASITNLGVKVMAISDTILYVGGNFSSIGDSARNNIAAINVITDKVTSWNPSANNSVFAIAVSGSIVYAGGGFNMIGDSSRNGIAAINTSTGLASAWNANCNNQTGQVVEAIAVTNSAIYVGGNFTYIGDSLRAYIAALDPITGLAKAWNPGQNDPIGSGAVVALAVSGSDVYAGGFFTFIGGQYRNHIAEIDASTGLSTVWNPGVTGTSVSTISLLGSTAYICGGFSSAGDSTRNTAAAINTINGEVTSWNPSTDGTITCLSADSSAIYIGGSYTMLDAQNRNYAAAIDLSTGQVTSWNPDADAAVEAIAVYGNMIYAGGYFANIGGQARSSIAALDNVTGAATSWDPEAKMGDVDAIAPSGAVIYVGGSFDNIGGDLNKKYLAAIDTSTGLPTSWNPNPDSYVYSIVCDGNVIYAAGDFFNAGDSTRHHIVALDSATGLATSWNPNANNEVRTLALAPPVLYAGGSFTNIGESLRNNIAAIDLSSGKATSWNPNANSFIYSFVLSPNAVYAGGDFTSIGGKSRNYAAAISPIDGSIEAWNPDLDYDVKSVNVSIANAAVFLGGSFNIISSSIHPFIGRVNDNELLAPPPPSLITFNFGDTLSIKDSVLIWNFESSAASYEIQISTDSIFSNVILDSAGITDTLFFPRSLSSNTKYFWRVRSMNNYGASLYSEAGYFISPNFTLVKQPDYTMPRKYSLSQNYPNPFNPSTIISYSVPKSSMVSIKVYDVLGREIETLVNEQKSPGNYKITFNAGKLASGIYFYQLRSSDYDSIKKMLLLK